LQRNHIFCVVRTDLHEEQPKEQNIAEYCEDIAPWATGRGMQAPACLGMIFCKNEAIIIFQLAKSKVI